MYDIFTKLLNMSLMAGILALVVIVIRLLLKKAPRKYVCILWALVALRLLCPISISSSLSAFNLLNLGTDSAGQIEYFQYNGKTEKPEILFDIPALVDDNMSTDSMTVGTHTSDLYLPTIMYIWMIGVAIMLICASISYVRLRKEIAASIHRRDNIYVCDEITSPFILGIIRPRIYIPSGMNDTTLNHVVAHEQAHIKRCDHWWKPLGYVLLSIYWFNPVLWIAFILLCRDIEVACDEKVISELGKEEIAGYSAALLACAAQRRMITACPIAFGETDVKNRVKNVLNYKKPAFWIIIIAILACVVGGICFLTNPKYESYSLKVVIPAGNTEQICYSEEQFSPRGNRIIISAGEGIENAEVSIKPVEVRTETAYDESYLLNSSNEVKLEVEKGGWFQLGVNMHNPTDEDMVVYVEVENVTVRIADVAADPPHNAMLAIVTEFDNGSMLVTPVEGSWELNSSDLFRIPIQNMESSPEPQVGDVIEVEYDGGILETYPASLENIIYISVVEQRDTGYDICPCVMVNGIVYFDTGYESSVTGRCGNMDGTIDSECAGSEIPQIDNQGNFGTGYGYQYGPLEGTIEILINEEWRVFATEEVKATYRGAISQPDVAAILETVTIDYGTSSIYTVDDMNAAIALIVNTFSTFEGCELHSLTYGSDVQSNTAENIAWMNDLETANDNQQVFTECIMFESSFRSPKNGGGAWNANEEYTWSWWLARGEGSGWKLMTWGY